MAELLCQVLPHTWKSLRRNVRVADLQMSRTKVLFAVDSHHCLRQLTHTPSVAGYFLVLSHQSRNNFDSLYCEGICVPLIQRKKDNRILFNVNKKQIILDTQDGK